MYGSSQKVIGYGLTKQLYAAYLEVIADFSASEKRQMLHDTAAEIYGL